MTSYPANFICAAKKPPIWASTTKFPLVKVESEVIFTRELQGAPDPVNGPVAKTNLFASSKGFVRRYFVIHNFVAEAHATDKTFKLTGIFEGNISCREIDS